MGRPKKPTALKVIAGTDQSCRICTDETMPKADKIPKPRGMSPKARKYWNQIEPMLKDCKVLTEVDNYALGILCTSIAEMFELQQQLDDDGYIAIGSKGQPIVNPLFRATRQKQDDVRKLLIEFGMTPSSRTRVGTVTDPNAKSDWDF